MHRLIALVPVMTLLFGYADASAAPSYATPVTPLAASPHFGAFAATPRGLGAVTGSIGSTAIVTLPGSAGEGLLMDNGNGTSTFIGPNRPPQAVATSG